MEQETLTIIISSIAIVLNLFILCILVFIEYRNKKYDERHRKLMEDYEKIKKGEMDNLNFNYDSLK